MNEVTGNLTGLKPSAMKALERVYRRRVSPNEVVSTELGGYLCGISREIERQVGCWSLAAARSSTSSWATPPS
jgi:hypothetical protein